MPLYDCGAEDCEECQQAFRGVKAKTAVTRDEIMALIRDNYDPEPKDWPRHRGWDDAAGDIADKILSLLAGQQPDQCRKCGLKADSMSHRFCTHADCAVRQRSPQADAEASDG